MAQTVSTHVDDDHVDSLQEMSENGDADSISEALRVTSSIGLSEKGYKNGVKKDTRLRGISRRCADAFGLLGVMWVGLTFLYPMGFRMWAVPIFGVAVALYGFDRVLGAYEPRVSRRLNGVLRGEKA